ncbi:hypothetical protein DSECCO2_590460 [anaerobic digester metagenome]
MHGRRQRGLDVEERRHEARRQAYVEIKGPREQKQQPLGGEIRGEIGPGHGKMDAPGQHEGRAEDKNAL